MFSNFGDNLTSTDWVRLGQVGGRLGRDLVVTESVGKILRWRAEIFLPGISVDNLYIQRFTRLRI